MKLIALIFLALSFPTEGECRWFFGGSREQPEMGAACGRGLEHLNSAGNGNSGLGLIRQAWSWVAPGEQMVVQGEVPHWETRSGFHFNNRAPAMRRGSEVRARNLLQDLAWNIQESDARESVFQRQVIGREEVAGALEQLVGKPASEPVVSSPTVRDDSGFYEIFVQSVRRILAESVPRNSLVIATQSVLVSPEWAERLQEPERQDADFPDSGWLRPIIDSGIPQAVRVAYLYMHDAQAPAAGPGRERGEDILFVVAFVERQPTSSTDSRGRNETGRSSIWGRGGGSPPPGSGGGRWVPDRTSRARDFIPAPIRLPTQTRPR